MIIPTSLYLIVSLLVAYIGRHSNLGFLKVFLFSVLLTPLIMMLYLLIFVSAEAEQDQKRRKRKIP